MLGALSELLAAIDARNVPRFLAFLTDDVLFRFGNFAPCRGKPATGAAVTAFFASIRECRHEVLGSWDHPDAVTCHGRVTYTRIDSAQVTVPFATVFLLSGKLINEYLIFVDVAPLYADLAITGAADS